MVTFQLSGIEPRYFQSRLLVFQVIKGLSKDISSSNWATKVNKNLPDKTIFQVNRGESYYSIR